MNPYPMTLAEQTGRRLSLAGYTADDPALLQIMEWNRAALARNGTINGAPADSPTRDGPAAAGTACPGRAR
jgi:hypothetical protein